MEEKLGKINEMLMGIAGRLIVASMSNPEVKEAHQMVLDASRLLDEIFEELGEG